MLILDLTKKQIFSWVLQNSPNYLHLFHYQNWSPFSRREKIIYKPVFSNYDKNKEINYSPYICTCKHLNNYINLITQSRETMLHIFPCLFHYYFYILDIQSYNNFSQIPQDYCLKKSMIQSLKEKNLRKMTIKS